MVSEPCNSKGGLTPPALLFSGGLGGIGFVACLSACCTCEVLYCDICYGAIGERELLGHEMS